VILLFAESAQKRNASEFNFGNVSINQIINNNNNNNNNNKNDKIAKAEAN
jgi:hypothetical protein